MLIYNFPKSQFLKDLDSDNIEDIIQDRFLNLLHRQIGRSEYMSWQNSLREMWAVVRLASIPDDASISIEYWIPGSWKRIDFIVSWLDEDENETIVIIELKQWQEAKKTDKDGIVETRFEHGNKETNHPSYQAWSYAMLLKWFNSVVYDDNIQLKPCAFLHNYKQDGIINHEFYSHHINQSPLFLKGEKQKLADFISRNIKHGDRNNMMFRIEHGKIRPSKALADSMASMLKGNQEFVMIDDQKVVFETALDLAKKSSELNKNVLIVEWWPGTGKSVVAINLLVNLINKAGLVAHYITKNSAPRKVYESRLTGTMRQTEFSNLFKSSWAYTESIKNEFDALIVDEAHRLNEKSGMFSHLWENQVKEIIESSKFSIFFIDEDQKVTLKDIGTKDEITKWAKNAWAKVHNLELSSQFRCNGSDGYLAWLDNTLQIKETANIELDTKDYDFRVFDNPNKLRDAIFEKNKINNKARLVAWYCWEWASKRDKNAFDITMPEHGFEMKWNLATDGMLWILAKESVNEIGCIHTCQGLEVDYVGVIVWDDLVVRNGIVVTNPDKRAKSDASLKWYKAQMKTHPEKTKALTDSIIKNTYRTLMTRGMKGCYVYFVDKETRDYFNSLIK